MESVTATGDGKVEFIAFADRTLARVNSAMGYPAYYPVHPVAIERPLEAVLMDLDGTSVRSEEFWIWIIQLSTASLLGDPFDYAAEDELIEQWKKAVSSMSPVEWKTMPGYGAAYSGPGGRARTKDTFEQ